MKYAVRAAAFLGVLFLACGCYHQKDNNLLDLPMARLRVVHAVDDGPLLTFVVSEQQRAQLDFGQASPILETILGNISVDVDYVDPDKRALTSLLQNIPMTTINGHVVTFVVYGSFAAPLSLTSDTVLHTLDAGQCEIQYINVSRESVDIYLTDASEALANVPPSLTLATGGFSDTLVEPANANYRLRVTPENDSTVVYDSDAFPIDEGVRTLVLVRDSFGPRTDALGATFADELATIVFPNVVDTVAIRALDAVADETSIDADITDQDSTTTILSTPLVYEELSPFTDTDPTTVTYAYGVASDPGNIAYQVANVSLTPSQFDTFVAAGSSTNQTLNGIFAARPNMRPVATVGRFQVINASESAGTVDVYYMKSGFVPQDGVPTLNSLVYLASAQSSVYAGPVDIYVTQAGTKDILVGPIAVDVVSHDLRLLYITDAAGGGTPVNVTIFTETPP